MGYNLLINGAYWGYNLLTNLLLTSWDIQVGAKLLLNFQAYGKLWKKSETLRISWKSPGRVELNLYLYWDVRSPE